MPRLTSIWLFAENYGTLSFRSVLLVTVDVIRVVSYFQDVLFKEMVDRADTILKKERISYVEQHEN